MNKYFVYDSNDGIIDWFSTLQAAEDCIMELKNDSIHESSGRIDDSLERLCICEVTHKTIIDNGDAHIQRVV